MRRKRWPTSKVIAVGILMVDGVATMAVLALCGLAILRDFTGALPYTSLPSSAPSRRPQGTCWGIISRSPPRRTQKAVSSTTPPLEVCPIRTRIYERSTYEKVSLRLLLIRFEEVHIMKEKLLKRAANLLSVKSLVTLVLTGVFAWMAVKGTISQDFMTIYAVIIAFYFGTQSQKVQDTVEQVSGDA